jgi:peptidoglycan/LPS O-acetylase OafA/YrhL
LRHRLGAGFNPGVLLGVSLGAILMKLSVAIRPWRFDDLAGRVSYGCYLAHWPLLTVIYPQDQHPWLGIPFALGAVLLGWISYRLVDLHILTWRRRLAGMRMPDAAPRRTDPLPGQASAAATMKSSVSIAEE